MSDNDLNDLNTLIYVLHKIEKKWKEAGATSPENRSPESKATLLLIGYLRDEGIPGYNQFLERLENNALTDRDRRRIRYVFFPGAGDMGRREALLTGTGVVAAFLGMGALWKSGYHTKEGLKAAAPADKQEHMDKANFWSAAAVGGVGVGAVFVGLSSMLTDYRRKRIENSHEFEAAVEELVAAVAPVLDYVREQDVQEEKRASRG
ncbi:MAG: hypothetical protein KGJ06_08315 [Pseudomonadota bacterium]|nr:hypothetical protein [Pseudomonadota bacterium]